MHLLLRWFIASLAVVGAASSAWAVPSVAVLADPGMSVALSDLARGYARRSGVSVNLSFANRQAQQSQINEGAPADILITPSADWIEELKSQGLVDIYSQVPIARDRLALIAPEDSPIKVDTTREFPLGALLAQFGWDPSFVVGNPETLREGAYGKEALRNLGVAGELEEFTLYVKQRWQMLDMVANQQMYGVVLYSSAKDVPGVQVLGLLPENTHQPIAYVAAAVAGDNMDEARKFLRYLESDEAKAIFTARGFQGPQTVPSP